MYEYNCTDLQMTKYKHAEFADDDTSVGSVQFGEGIHQSGFNATIQYHLFQVSPVVPLIYGTTQVQVCGRSARC